MPNLSSHNPITMYETISGNTELTLNPPQAAGQTFKLGTPVSLNATGFAQAWDGATLTGAPGSIYGVAEEAASNFAVAGQGAPSNFGQIGPPWATLSGTPPPNQPNAVVIPYGAPLVTGGVLTMLATQDTLFKAQTDNSDTAATITAASVTSNVLSATATNTHWVGEKLLLSGFTSAGVPLNGLTATVVTASGSAYTASLSATIANIATAGAGADAPVAISPSQADVGLKLGLTVDSNGTWYIDYNKRTSASNTCVEIISLYPADVLQSTPFTEVPNGQLVFKFQASTVNL
jgi:hypothetical protein